MEIKIIEMKILYIGFSRSDYSIDGIYLQGLKENNIEVIKIFYPDKSFKRYFSIIKKYFKHRRGADFVIVGSSSPTAVIVLRLFSFKKIVYNALCSEYERIIVSRGLAKPFSFKAFYYWLQDYLAMHLANVVMLESQNQIDYLVRLFKIRRKKCFLAWTGVNDQIFKYDPNLAKFETFTALFRGRLLPEAGAEHLVRAAKKLDRKGVKILMLSGGQELEKIQSLIKDLQPECLELITEFLPEGELLELMSKSHLSLGQLGIHSRLNRTIPHKAYESLSMKLPYLTARNKGVMELLTENKNCLAFNPGDSDDLADKILWAKENTEKLLAISENAYNLYKQKLTPKSLVASLLERIKSELNNRL